MDATRDATGELAGKVALVTGAGSGIGKAAALLLAAHGARVAALSRTADEVRATADEIVKGGGEGMAVEADVASADQMRGAVQRTVDRWSRLDIVLANAGINGVWAPLEELSPEDWTHTIATNLTGTFLTIKYAAPHLKKQGGSIIVTSSVNGTRVFSNTGATAYATSKAGQLALANMLAVELAPHNVRINVICPGAVETEIDENTQRRDLAKVKFPVEYPKGEIPLGDHKPATARQVAELMLFLASDASSHITGTPIWIDGGSSLVRG